MSSPTPLGRVRPLGPVLAALAGVVAFGCSSTTGVTAVDTRVPAPAGGTAAPVGSVPAPSAPGSSAPGSSTPGQSAPVATAPTRSFPPVPEGGKDCGVVNLMSGWPTTAAPRVDTYTCVASAAAAGTPARLSIVEPSSFESGRRTSDGYSIPAATVMSYVVQGPSMVIVTTDTREQPGGAVVVQRCTGLSQPSGPMSLEPTGCTAT